MNYIKFTNFSDTEKLHTEFERLRLYINKNRNTTIAVNTLDLLLIIIFNTLKKDNNYIFVIGKNMNLEFYYQIKDFENDLLLNFDSTYFEEYIKVRLFNHSKNKFSIPFQFNFSNIDRNLDNFLIDTIVFKNEDSETKIISYDYNKQITLTLKSYTFYKYFHESINEPLKIFYYFVFKNKFPNTKISLEKFSESPKSIYELEKIISY